MKIGIVLPQFGATWAEMRDFAQLCDEEGFDSLWLADHFFGVGGEDPLEAWTCLSAVAASTSRIELGFQVLCNNYRSPALVAKMAATLDHVSGGRLILGYGAGWFAQEYEAYGYEFPSIRTRLEQLEEALEILRLMWTEDEPVFHGVHYQLEQARCRPRPTREPHPPIMVGGGGEKVLLKLVARFADVWNNMGATHGEVARKLEILRAHCEKLGRDPGEISVSQQTIGAIALDRAEARSLSEKTLAEIGFLTGSPDLCPMGTPDEIIARVRQNAELGIDRLIVHFGRTPGSEAIRTFAREVLPACR